MKKIKLWAKKNKIILKIYDFLLARPLINKNNKNNKKKALLSYSVYPFKSKKGDLKHPNFIECFTLNEVLDKNLYNVDIYNNTYTGKINYNQYDLIIGEGIPITNYFKKQNKNEIKTIYYATGSHPFFNNISSYKAIFNFYNRKFFLPLLSSRITNFDWGIAASLAQNHIIIGNEVTKKSFLEYSNSNKYLINPPYYSVNKVLDFSKKNKRKYLWFGSYGLVHKGLDLVIESFIKNPEIELHVCGYLENEKNIIDSYSEYLKETKNIYFHGFISLDSKQFLDLMENCSFVILASCSEGCATAVITAMGNGGLIPIVTKETGIDLNYGIEIKSFDVDAINNALKDSFMIQNNEIKEKSLIIIEYIERNYSIEIFKKNLEKIILKII